MYSIMNADSVLTAAPEDIMSDSNICTNMYICFKNNYVITCEEFPQAIPIANVKKDPYWQKLCNHWRIQYYADGTFTLSYKMKTQEMFLQIAGSTNILWTNPRPSDYVYKWCRFHEDPRFSNVYTFNGTMSALHLNSEGVLCNENIQMKLENGTIPLENCEIIFTENI